MIQRSLTPLLLVCAAVGLACGSESGFAPPEPGSVFTRLEVLPTDFALGATAPGNTLQLTVWSYDFAGAPTEGTYAATYSSSDPGIAGVTSSGVATAVAPGTTTITVSLTLSGITRTASTTVTVHTRNYSDIAGVYDFAALITNSDGWGYEGYRYTAVLTLEEASGPRWLGGRYTDLRLIGPDGDSLDVTHTGLVTGSIDVSGRAVIELLRDGNEAGLILIVDSVSPGFIDGSFCCGNFGGTFTAERRRAE